MADLPPVSSAFTVADEFLKIAKRRGEFLTPMQLIKLVYIAHGWFLALRGQDLFGDRIEAWKYGPVIPDLYRATKHFGRNPIPHHLVNDEPSGIPDDVRPFLEDVYSKYGSLSGIQLSNLTHRAGSPWYEVFSSGEYNGEITDEVIRRHYLGKLNEQRSSTAG